jgi:phospholipid/cholesterol/gamma-HCH transport system substrate-binding protein
MKFRIRYADQIVGVLIIVVLVALSGVIVLLGAKQRWFAKNYTNHTNFDAGTGLSNNMAVQYKGFTIGNVKSFHLSDDDRVEVVFTIQDTYNDRVKEGSLVQLNISPVGLGNSFVFYPGLGTEQLAEGDLIPNTTSPEARYYLERALAYIPNQNDSITLIISQVNTALENINRIASSLDRAFNGTDQTELGRVLRHASAILANLETLSAAPNEQMIQPALSPVLAEIDSIVDTLRPLIANLETISGDVKTVSGTLASGGGVLTALDGTGDLAASLNDSLKSVSGTLKSVEQAAAFVPTQLPQISILITELQSALLSAEDVLAGLKNNPLLKNGIPEAVQTETTGTSLRDIAF